MPNRRISVHRRLAAASAALSVFLLLSAFLFSPVPTIADPLDKRSHPDSAAAVATVAQFRSALAAGDTAAVLSLLAPDVVILESGGVETRSEYRSHHLAADMDFAKALPGARSPLRAVVEGGVAWVSSTSAVKGRFRDRANRLGRCRADGTDEDRHSVEDPRNPLVVPLTPAEGLTRRLSSDPLLHRIERS